MATDKPIEAFTTRLEDESLDIRSKATVANELRDSVDTWLQSGHAYAHFLTVFIPTCLKLLGGPPTFVANSPEQKLRKCLLETLHRLPQSLPESMEQFATQIVDRVMGLIRQENEENALLCVKVVMDFQRHHTRTLYDKVQPFLDLIQEMFESVEQMVKDTFVSSSGVNGTATTNGTASASPPRANASGDAAGDHGGAAQTLPKSMQSFKVVSELPIAVVSIFQIHAYKPIMETNVHRFLALIKKSLQAQVPAQVKAREEASANGTLQIGPCKEIKERAAFAELINAQVKILSFFAYIIRAYGDRLQEHMPPLPPIIVRILQDCPRERCTMRRELFVAIRHIINFKYRKLFLDSIDDLLDERTLIGDGLTVDEALTPLAYSTLADLLHHLRESLTQDQIRTTIRVYRKNLLSSMPGTSFQTMSAKLLMNMAPSIARLADKQEARYFLISILDAIGDKLAAMNRQFTNAKKISAHYERQSVDAAHEDYLAIEDQPPDWDEIDIFTSCPIKTASPRERALDPVTDNKFLFRNLVQGLKGVFYELRQCNPPELVEMPNAPINWKEIACGFSTEEVQVLIKLFHEGIQVFQYYDSEKPPSELQLSPQEMLGSHHSNTSKDEKELLENFATVFHHVDHATFHEIFRSEIPHIYRLMFDHPALLQIPQFLLASEATSPSFAGMLLQFLMDHIEDIGSANLDKAFILLRLFKLSFMAVTLFSVHNEQVLLPHVNKLVTKSIKLSTTAEAPMQYFYLLRSLFRSIGGGRFEHLYKEILPLLEMLLEVLNNLIGAARNVQERELYVELSLTVPARLSNLLPHLNYLMKPLVLALRAGSDLVGQGLRTLELCVDNLTADYLDPIMAPVIDELMTALWEHLKPSPYSHFHAHTTMRILGKLGGRNRKFLDGPPGLTFEKFTDANPTVDIRLVGAQTPSQLPASLGITLAIAKLQEHSSKQVAVKASDAFYKRQALNLIITQASLLLGTDVLTDDFVLQVKLQAQDLVEENFAQPPNSTLTSERELSVLKRNDQQTLLKNLLKACMLATSIESLAKEAQGFLENVCRHFAILEVAQALQDAKRERLAFHIDSGAGPLYIDHRVLIDAIVESLASEEREVRATAESALISVRDAAVVILGSPDHVAKLPFFTHLVATCCHSCYQEEWFAKSGGTLGIKIALDQIELDSAWMVERQLDICRALMYAAKDLPDDLPATTRNQALETLTLVLKMCNKGVSGETAAKTPGIFHNLCGFLLLELSHTNGHVRKAAQDAFSVLAEVTGAEVHQLVSPVKDRLFDYIFNKPLRLLPFALQIAYIDAIAYCMSLKNDIVESTEHVGRFLKESANLADQEPEAAPGRAVDQRNLENITRLKISCIHLLSLAQSMPGFRVPDDAAKAKPAAADASSAARPATSEGQAANQSSTSENAPSQRPSSTEGQAAATTQTSSTAENQSSEANAPKPVATQEDLMAAQAVQIRQQTAHVLFRALYSKQPEVLTATREALKTILETDNKIAREVLTVGLRPVLGAISDASKLRPDTLNCLRSLLQIMRSYFKSGIGVKLLENIPLIATDEILQKASFKLIEQHDTISIIVSILDIFHLLPPQASSFLSEIVSKVIGLEQKLRRTHFSPFRGPVLRFLNQYPKDAWTYFGGKLFTDRDSGRFFAQMLRDENSRKLRAIVAEEHQKLIDALNGAGSDTYQITASINAIDILEAISRFPESRGPLLSNEALRKSLLEQAVSLEQGLQSNNIEAGLRLAAEQAGQRAMRFLSIYLGQSPDDLDTLFELVSAITSQNVQETPDFQQFLYEHVVCNTDISYRRKIIERSVHVWASQTAPEATKGYLFRYLVNPILLKDVMSNWDILFKPNKGTGLVNDSLIEVFETELWKPQQSIEPLDENIAPGTDHSRIELLQMTAILLKYYNKLMAEHRREVFRFGWMYVRLQDIINKYAAYVVIAYFIAQFDCPGQVAAQVFKELIGAHAGEARPLVVQALELFAPVIPERMQSLRKSGSDVPVWAQLARRPILEDPSNLQQMLSVFQFVARHPDLFYEAREQFTQTIIPSIHKVAQLPSNNIDSKRIALSLISLIKSWEQRLVSETESKPANGNGHNEEDTEMTDASAPAPAKVVTCVVGNNHRMMLIKYIVQFIASMPDRYPLHTITHRDKPPSTQPYSAQSAEFCRRAVNLFQSLLAAPHWTDLDVDAMFPKVTEHVLLADPKPDEKFDMGHTRVINTLQIVRAIVNVKSDEWILAQLPQLQKLLEKPVRNAHLEIQESLYGQDDQADPPRRPLIQRILDAIPAEKPEEDAMVEDVPGTEFITFLNTVATETFGNGNTLAGTNVLGAFAVCRPSAIDSHIPTLMKALNQCLRDHQAAANSQATQAAAQQSGRPSDASHPAPPDPATIELQVQFIVKIIDILAGRIAQLSDNRRPYLSTLTTLIERSPSHTICLKILDLATSWIFDAAQAYPTLKEKTAVILKMITWEHRSDKTLFEKFLELVIRVYEDTKITRSELAIRLEPAFLIGTRAQNVEVRDRFMNLFDRHLSRTAGKRMLYLLAQQNWDNVGDTFWLSQVIHLLIGCVEMERPISLGEEDFRTIGPGKAYQSAAQDPRLADSMIDERFDALVASHRRFIEQVSKVKAEHVLQPLCYLQHSDATLATEVWIALFPIFWANLSKEERSELQPGLIALMTREFHLRQMDKRPNCVQALLEGIARAENPRINFPHHLIKFLARTHNAWYIATCFMEQTAIEPVINTAAVRESNMDALAEVYADLSEEDMFYGLWRRRAQFLMTNTALSYEQVGNWDKAQQTFEQATLKARNGEVPLSQSEYMLWEDHWVICAQKLQQWEILSEFAKLDNLNDLYLDSVWRQFDKWQSPEQLKQLDAVVKSVSDSPTPRRLFFQSFMSLLNMHMQQEPPQVFQRVCDDSIQLSIRKWHSLPQRITNAHVPILQNFQQLVELHDASVICASLQSTTQANLDQKAPELKLLLGTWRDRLPNFWDDINAWQDLVTWRRHIFNMVNEKYLSLVPQQQGNSTGSSYAYRGYHEIAWTINKFAHVARKHNLPEVCINYLGMIYTLPNIEIQEAFLKLREQAKCHYQNPSELQTGLDVINNTNLNYFGPQQKAEFFTLKGMFLAKQHQMQEADQAFGSALYYDLKLPKAWAEWARYNEQLYKENPSDISKAAAAVSCYLEAAACYKNSKSRKALGRVLWLLSLDDAEGTIARTFEESPCETPTWYWINYIPQLLLSLSRPEARIAKVVLIKLAKQFPQALYFHLRTSREDHMAIRRNQEAKARTKQATQGAGSPDQNRTQTPSRPNTSEGRPQSAGRPGTSSGEIKPDVEMKTEETASTQAQDGQVKTDGEERPKSSQQQSNANTSTPQQQQSSQAQGQTKEKGTLEHLDEVYSILKSSFPLLAFCMETMVDQLNRNFKSAQDEEAYRLINALLNDALNFAGRALNTYQHGTKLPASTEGNIQRFAESILPAHIRGNFEADFVKEKLDVVQYITKLRKWRDRFEERLDRRREIDKLENHGYYLSEFKFQKLDEVEVPGQYLQHRDKNQDFVRISRFLPDVEQTRGSTNCQKRLKIRGHDGTIHSFIVQHPAPRTSRREERIQQLFRFFNDILARRKETRRRKIQFTLPATVPFSPALRLVQDDPSYISLMDIYDDWCRRKHLSKDEPTLFAITRLRELAPKTNEQVNQVRLQIFQAIQNKFVPPNVVVDYFKRTHNAFADFWLFRRQVAYQLAAHTFMTYTMLMRERLPTRMHFSRGTGNVWGSEMVPNMAGQKPVFHNPDPVPVRLTPNLQMLLGPIALEGIMSASVLVIAKVLTESKGPVPGAASNVATNGETATANGVSATGSTQGASTAAGASTVANFDSAPTLSPLLSLFIREEIYLFYTNSAQHQRHGGGTVPPSALREHVANNSEIVVKRALSLCRQPGGPLPAGQSVVDLIGRAAKPEALAAMEWGWMGWL